MQELLENEENLAVAHVDDETEEIIVRSTKASGEKSHIVALSKSVGGVKAVFQHSFTPRTRRARTILQGNKLYEKDRSLKQRTWEVRPTPNPVRQ